MHPVILLWITLTVAIHVGVQEKNYISKRDREFVGPDKRLELLLKQRMTPPSFLAAELRSLEKTASTFIPSVKPKPFIGDTRREIQFHEYNAEHLKIKILQFQQYLIHLSRGFIEDIEPLVERFETDERFRVANIFAKLKQWLYKMRTLLQATINEPYQKHYIYYSPHPRRVVIYFYYYQHMLRIHIDLTYTVEFLMHIHSHYIESVSSTNRSGSVGDGDGDIDPDREEKLTKLFDKLQERNATQDQLQYYLQMIEAGLQPTSAP